MNGLLNQDTWYPVILTDSTDFKTGITGRIYSDITCKYFKTGSTAQTVFTVTADNWKEAGEGKYSIKIGAFEWVEIALYQVSISCSGCIVYNFPVDVQALPGGSGSVPIIIHLQDIESVPILNGYVQVFDNNLLKIQALGNTDINGNLSLALNPGTYKVLISKQGIYTFTVPETMIVITSDTFIFIGTPIPPVPPITNCQLLYVYPVDISNTIATQLSITVAPQDENEEISPYFLVNNKVHMEYVPSRIRFEANILKNANVIIEGRSQGEQFLYGRGQIDNNDSKNLIDYDWINS
jgi:hypothetical protein